MVKVLLDTCVLSELNRQAPNPKVWRAVESLQSQESFISVLSIGEIARGLMLLDAGKKKLRLQKWLQRLERHFADRILPIDRDTAYIFGEITAAAQKKRKTLPVADTLIAATARRHGLHVMTRNVKDFEPTGALVINPWREAA